MIRIQIIHMFRMYGMFLFFCIKLLLSRTDNVEVARVVDRFYEFLHSDNFVTNTMQHGNYVVIFN